MKIPAAASPNSLAMLEERHPWVRWREPVEMATFALPEEKHYGCRVCIANAGISGWEIAGLPTDPEVVRAHIRSEHGG